MLKKITEKRMQEVIVTVDEKMICDECGKEIKAGYWSLRTGHNDWGNDSIESVEHFDLCSPDCAREKFEEYIKESDSVLNSMYFELEHRG